MTPTQLRDTITKASLTQAGLAAMLDIDERTMRRWLAGDTAIPHMAALAIEYLSSFSFDQRYDLARRRPCA